MRKPLLLILCLLSLTASFARASTVQLPQSGQTTIYSPGDDGDIRIGKPWSNPRFSGNNDQTVTDRLTSLIWTKQANLIKVRDPGLDKDGIPGDGAVSWQHALEYVNRLNQEKYLGFSDWRLPNLNEIASLVNQGESGNSTWLNSQGFSKVQPVPYWSSSTNVLNTGTAWTVAMGEGRLQASGKSGTAYVWPVRGGQSGNTLSSDIILPKTGQVACFDSNGTSISCAGTGQDGELQIGAAWPQPRFSYNGDQTVYLPA